MDSYKWKEIDELRFNMSYASNRLRLTINYKRVPAKTIDFSVLYMKENIENLLDIIVDEKIS